MAGTTACRWKPAVALRKESVDRNLKSEILFQLLLAVALRKESVDRNLPGLLTTDIIKLSLSARRAWIEISSQ